MLTYAFMVNGCSLPSIRFLISNALHQPGVKMRKTTSTQRPQVTTRRGKPVCMVQSGASMIRQRQNGTQMVQRLRHIHGILLAEFFAVRDAVFL